MEIKIFEPALCCESGVCGPSIDPELLRITAVVRSMNKRGFQTRRYNLAMSPMEFTKHGEVTALMQEKGMEVLPITLRGDAVVKMGSYPTNAELSEWSGLDMEALSPSEDKILTF